MRAFLTGGTGFVGSRLARVLLERGHDVHALIRPRSDRTHIHDLLPKIHVISGDLGSIAEWAGPLRDCKPDVAFHLAWGVEPGNYQNATANLTYVSQSLALALALAEGGCRHIVAAGTCHEYDTDHGFLSESTPTNPRSLYAASKLALHLMLDRFARGAGIRSNWLRFFYLFGPFEDPRRLIPSVILSLLQERPARVTPGDQIRDFLHVDDVARAIVAVAESEGLEGIVNIGSGQPVTVRDVVERIGSLTGKAKWISLGALPYPEGDPMRIWSDNSRLKSHTGWTPRFTLDEGLRQTIDWWQGHR